MDDTRRYLPKELVELGVPLADDPLENAGIAWTRENAERVLAWMRDAGLAALGGAVYERQGSRLIPCWALWHAETDPTESFPDYAARSIEVALDYIRGFPERPEETILYEITMSHVVFYSV